MGRLAETYLQYGVSSDRALVMEDKGLSVNQFRKIKNSQLMENYGLELEEITWIMGCIKRHPIELPVIEELLKNSNGVCCCCKGIKSSSYIFHHIKPYEDSQDNRYENLAVLCPNDHDLAHSQSNLTRKLTPDAIRRLKEDWENEVRPHNLKAAKAELLPIEEKGLLVINREAAELHVKRIPSDSLNIYNTLIEPRINTYNGQLNDFLTNGNEMIQRTLHQKNVEELLVAKFNSDMANSLCCNRDYIQIKTNQAIDNLKDLRIYSETDERFSKIKKEWIGHCLKSDGKPLEDIATQLSRFGEIRIALTNVVVSACAATHSLANRYFEKCGLKLSIDCDFGNGRKLIDALDYMEPPDFLIAPIEPFALSKKVTAQDYRFVIPLCTEFQSLFWKKGGAGIKNRHVHVYQDSSAQFHFDLGYLVPPRVTQEPFENISFFDNPVKNIAAGDYVIAWEPLANIFENSEHFDKINGSTHDVIFCLLCRKEWIQENMAKNLSHFVLLFINELKHCNINRVLSLNLLKKDSVFMSGFADGAGLRWTPMV